MCQRQNQTKIKSLLTSHHSIAHVLCYVSMALMKLLKFGNFSAQQCVLSSLFRHFIVCISAVMCDYAYYHFPPWAQKWLVCAYQIYPINKYIKIHVPSMLAKGIETINKQSATMAQKIHKSQPQRAQKILKQPPWLRKITISSHNGL